MPKIKDTISIIFGITVLSSFTINRKGFSLFRQTTIPREKARQYSKSGSDLKTESAAKAIEDGFDKINETTQCFVICIKTMKFYPAHYG